MAKVAAACAILIIASLIAASKWPTNSRAVQKRLESAVASGQQTFDFASVTPFKLDRMFVFDCYSASNEVEGSLGFLWPDYERSAIHNSDSVVLLVFVRNGEVVCWHDQPRSIELGGLANRTGYSPSESTFQIKKQDNRHRLEAIGTPKPPLTP